MKNIITIATIFLLFISCKKDRLTSNGNMITVTRNLAAFTGVQGSGANDIHINYGNEYKVELRGSSNLIPYFKTEIVNGKLYLSYEKANISNDDVVVFVTLPMLKSVSLSGSSKVDLNGNFPVVNFFEVSLSGAGNMEAKDNIAAEKLAIDISGSGAVNLEKLATKLADVSVSGSGNVHIAVKDKLTASISGSGKIYYTGNPIVESHISGSGKIINF